MSGFEVSGREIVARARDDASFLRGVADRLGQYETVYLGRLHEIADALQEGEAYHTGFREGWRARAAAADKAGLPSSLTRACCGGTLELDYQQLTPWGMLPAAMEIHAPNCPAMRPT